MHPYQNGLSSLHLATLTPVSLHALIFFSLDCTDFQLLYSIFLIYSSIP